MLKNRKLAGLIVLAVALAASNAVFAQKTVRLNSTTPAFRTFFKKFARAVNKGSGTEIASMTSFPFQWGFDAGDEGTWTRNEFLKEYGKVFMPQPLVFKEKNPQFSVQGNTYTLTHGDDASYFTFKKRGGTYKLISYIVEP